MIFDHNYNFIYVDLNFLIKLNMFSVIKTKFALGAFVENIDLSNQ